MRRLLNLSAILLYSLQTEAFAPVAVTSSLSSRHVPNPAELHAKRRRRKDASPSPPSSTDDELPDFDIDEDDDVVASQSKMDIPSKSTPVKSPPKLSTTTTKPTTTPNNAQLATDLGGDISGLDQDLILSAMRGSGESWMPPTSIEDTLRDRSLEKLMNFDRQRAQDSDGKVVELPTMEEVIERRKRREAQAVQEGRIEEAAMLIDTTGMGKKAAKRAERKAAALQREEEESSGGGFDLEGLNVLKLLENGAWVGIGMLVLWELYINSPFFERAAPLIPAVFD